MHPKDLSINDFDYHLPAEKIALFPLEKRDESRLLIFNKNKIEEDIYKNIADHLPQNSFLIFNDTKVIKARIIFPTPTGSFVEIFCLEPKESVKDYAVVLQATSKVVWKCFVGRASKWKESFLQKTIQINQESVSLHARIIEKQADAFLIEFTWEPNHFSFAEILESAGETPLPPYIKRKANEQDATQYQTIYSAHEGSVAAPTAGLHFTNHIFDSFKEKKIHHDFVTLHVGAGTFKPVKSETMEMHEMHAEWMDVSVGVIENIIKHLSDGVFCVGTTSVRTLESLYWMGVKTHQNPHIAFDDLMMKQWEVYDEILPDNITPEDSLRALIQYLHENDLDRILIPTQIIVAPGYQFRLIKGIITNFHQPKSTLLLLVAAMIGKEWKGMYQYALEHDFRFLSYGDGCLIFNSF